MWYTANNYFTKKNLVVIVFKKLQHILKSDGIVLNNLVKGG